MGRDHPCLLSLIQDVVCKLKRLVSRYYILYCAIRFTTILRKILLKDIFHRCIWENYKYIVKIDNKIYTYLADSVGLTLLF